MVIQISSGQFIIRSRTVNPKLFKLNERIYSLYTIIAEDNMNRFEDLWCKHFPFKRWYVKNKSK